jgi:Arc/MetJ-type ribon-helix-helix transcriptional regulator
MIDPDEPYTPGDVTLERKTDADSSGRSDNSRNVRTGLDDFKNSVRDFAQKLPDQIGKAIESLQARANAITVQVDDETQRKIDSLVEAGVFKTRSDSAAYLIHEGIRARAEVFDAISARIAEIERIRGDMQRIISGPGASDESR